MLFQRGVSHGEGFEGVIVAQPVVVVIAVDRVQVVVRAGRKRPRARSAFQIVQGCNAPLEIG